jgi:hypothetical protein
VRRRGTKRLGMAESGGGGGHDVRKDKGGGGCDLTNSDALNANFEVFRSEKEDMSQAEGLELKALKCTAFRQTSSPNGVVGVFPPPPSSFVGEEPPSTSSASSMSESSLTDSLPPLLSSTPDR